MVAMTLQLLLVTSFRKGAEHFRKVQKQQFSQFSKQWHKGDPPKKIRKRP